MSANTATHEASIRNVLAKTEGGRRYLLWLDSLYPDQQDYVMTLISRLMQRVKTLGPLGSMEVACQLGRFLFLNECGKARELRRYSEWREEQG